MNSGTVKWFSDAKGYGFIIPDGQDREVFVHFRSIEMPGRKTLQTNQRVEFEFEQSERGLHAIRTRIARHSCGTPAYENRRRRKLEDCCVDELCIVSAQNCANSI